jgi:hypothetical protein
MAFENLTKYKAKQINPQTIHFRQTRQPNNSMDVRARAAAFCAGASEKL